MKIWLFHHVCWLLYLVCAVSRSEVLASVLCFRLGLVWRFCFAAADFSWLVLLLATRSASLASSFSPWSTRSFQSLFLIWSPSSRVRNIWFFSAIRSALPGLCSLLGSFGPCQFSSPVSFPAARSPVRSGRVSFSRASAPANLRVEHRWLAGCCRCRVCIDPSVFSARS
jgi:hypothetical protein